MHFFLLRGGLICPTGALHGGWRLLQLLMLRAVLLPAGAVGLVAQLRDRCRLAGALRGVARVLKLLRREDARRRSAAAVEDQWSSLAAAAAAGCRRSERKKK